MWYLINTIEIIFAITFFVAANKSMKNKENNNMKYTIFFFALSILSLVALGFSIKESGIVL